MEGIEGRKWKGEMYLILYLKFKSVCVCIHKLYEYNMLNLFTVTCMYMILGLSNQLKSHPWDRLILPLSAVFNHPKFFVWSESL